MYTYVCGEKTLASICHALSCNGDLKRLLLVVDEVPESMSPAHSAMTRTPVIL